MENILKSFLLDAETGTIFVNGNAVKNVSAFSLVLKDGECGLRITYDDRYVSKEKSKKFYLDLCPCEIAKQ